MESDLLPATDGLFLGSDTRRWKGNKLILDAVESNILPDLSDQRNLGSLAKRWLNAYASYFFVGSNTYFGPNILQFLSGDYIERDAQGIRVFWSFNEKLRVGSNVTCSTDLDLSSHKLLTDHFSTKEELSGGAWWFNLRDRLDTIYGNLRINSFDARGYCKVDGFFYLTAELDFGCPNPFTIYHWNGSAWNLVAEIYNAQSALDILRGGNITFLSGKIANILNGVLRLPNTRPASPQAGDTRYDPATDTFEIYDGTQWRAH